MIGIYTTASAEDTVALGKQLGETLPSHSVIALHGDLGAGKTTFVRGLAEGVCQSNTIDVTSPTFSLLHRYEGMRPLFHFDLYRLPRPEEFISAGFDEYFEAGGVCCIEWAEKIPSILPPHTLQVTLLYTGEYTRNIHIQYGKITPL